MTPEQIDQIKARLKAATHPLGRPSYPIEHAPADMAALLEDNERLRNTMQLHAGDCLSLDNDIQTLREEVERLRASNAELVGTLKAVVADILDYERVNNLSPNPPRTECWDSVTRASAAIAKAEATK